MNTNIPVAILAHMKPQTLANLIEAYREIEEIKKRVFTKIPKRKVGGVEKGVQKKWVVRKGPRRTAKFIKKESDLETECSIDCSTDCSTDSDEDYPNDGDSDTTLRDTQGSTRSESKIDLQLLNYDSQPGLTSTLTISVSDAITEESTRSADTCHGITMNEHGLYVCGYEGKCKLAYKSRASVYRHWVNRHNVAPPLKCSQCSARFWALAQLAWHERKCERSE